jgi:hypothetical protein
MVLRGHWCDTVLNAHASTDNESDDSKDNFYEEFGQVFSYAFGTRFFVSKTLTATISPCN